MKRIFSGLVLLVLVGCSTGPVLYPNAHLKMVGETRAHRDIADCEQQADIYIKSNAGEEAVKNTAVGAAGGAVVGGAVGSVAGALGRGAAMGAAGGAAAGLVRGIVKASEPSPLFKSFVERCLREKGYEPIGWQ